MCRVPLEVGRAAAGRAFAIEDRLGHGAHEASRRRLGGDWEAIGRRLEGDWEATGKGKRSQEASPPIDRAAPPLALRD